MFLFPLWFAYSMMRTLRTRIFWMSKILSNFDGLELDSCAVWYMVMLHLKEKKNLIIFNRLLLETKYRRLPVVDADGRLVMISFLYLLRFFCSLFLLFSYAILLDGQHRWHHNAFDASLIGFCFPVKRLGSLQGAVSWELLYR